MCDSSATTIRDESSLYDTEVDFESYKRKPRREEVAINAKSDYFTYSRKMRTSSHSFPQIIDAV